MKFLLFITLSVAALELLFLRVRGSVTAEQRIIPQGRLLSTGPPRRTNATLPLQE